jgi:uncharacterized protein (TIGR03435 family)
VALPTFIVAIVICQTLPIATQSRSLLADVGALSFEVASIRPSRADHLSLGVGVPGRFDAQGATVMRLIAAAFGGTSGSLPTSRIVVSPKDTDLKWIDADTWDIVAGLPDGTDGIEPSLKMLQTLLRDRFRLRLHTERRSLPIYALTINAREHRGLRPSDVDCDALLARESRGGGSPRCGWQLERGAVITIAAKGVTLREMAHRLSSIPSVGRVVEDRTNLAGTWDFDLTYEPTPTLPNDAATGAPTTPQGPSIFTALEELGVTLVPARGPVEVLVVDGAQKPSND